MKTNLPNLPDNYRVDFEGTNIICTYSLAFPKKYATEMAEQVLGLYGIKRTRKGYRCFVSEVAIDHNDIFNKYIKLKNTAMTQCRLAKIHALNTQVTQLSLF